MTSTAILVFSQERYYALVPLFRSGVIEIFQCGSSKGGRKFDRLVVFTDEIVGLDRVSFEWLEGMRLCLGVGGEYVRASDYEVYRLVASKIAAARVEYAKWAEALVLRELLERGTPGEAVGLGNLVRG